MWEVGKCVIDVIYMCLTNDYLAAIITLLRAKIYIIIIRIIDMIEYCSKE